jgi:hypothetical protein
MRLKEQEKQPQVLRLLAALVAQDDNSIDDNSILLRTLMTDQIDDRPD